MKKILKITLQIFIFSFLTILTQVGGLVYLLCLVVYKRTDRWASNTYIKVTSRSLVFLVLYSITCFIIVPLIAKPLGRVQLPLCETHGIRPLNAMTYFLNRNYVRPALRQTVFEVGEKMQAKYPGTIINYLDANFPFIDNYPLLPHLSHNDGKKIDISFCYRDAKTNTTTNDCPSFIGYGICEDPKANEKNTAQICAEQGFWQYSLLKTIVPQSNNDDYTFDDEKTSAIVSLFADQPGVTKIFIEPHLKTRFNLRSEKIRFHGCQAVRHDDHIHIEHR